MEKAIFINRKEQLESIHSGYQRIYFGQEFCQRLIPDSDALKCVMDYAKKRKMCFSFVTPYVTNVGLAQLRTLFKVLKEYNFSDEVIINDWGVLNIINSEYQEFIPVLGRLLTKQKGCPRVAELLKRKKYPPKLIVNFNKHSQDFIVVKKNLPKNLDYYYKGSNVSSVPVIHDFLNSQRIKRIELDNLNQDLVLEIPKRRLSASIYFPYGYITTTFFCQTSGCQTKKNLFFRLKPCNRQCQKYVFELSHQTMPQKIYLKGNTHFYRNDHIHLRTWEKLGINRLVFEPEIPI